MTPANYLLKLDQPAYYRLRVSGRLKEDWSQHFGGMLIMVEHSEDGAALTTLSGMVADQAGLHGLLNHIRDLGLPLLAVEYLSNPSFDTTGV
jgi:hypothetical protein